MKKIIRIALIAVMLVGITFSISTFISVELQSIGKGLRGVWIAEGICGGIGDQCDIGTPSK